MPVPSDAEVSAGAPADPPLGLDLRRKRARFRAWHRGMREMDLVMGRFADQELATLGEGELDWFERLMDAPDQQVYAWVTARVPTPPEFDTPLLQRLRAYRG